MSATTTTSQESSAAYLIDSQAPEVSECRDRRPFGQLPDDWEVATLGALGRSLSGGTPRTSDARFWGGDIPWVSAKDMKSPRLRDSADHVTPLALDKGTTLVEPGTILMVVRGMSLAHSFPVAIAEEPLSFNQDLKAFVPHSDVSGEFILRWLEANQEKILSLVTEATHGTKRIPSADLFGSLVPIPPAGEQRAIADTLSDVDALIGKLEDLIGKKRAIKRATMHQLLTGETRLPEFSGEWEQVELGELFRFKNGLNKAKRFFGQGTPIVNYMDVFENPALKSSDLSGRVLLSRQEIKTFDVRRGDVFFTRTSETPAEVGIASVMLDEPTDTVFSGFVLRARPRDNRLCDEFKAYCFRSRPVRTQIVSTASYTTRALTNGRLLSRVSVSVPPKEEQAAIATVLSDMDAEISALKRRRDKTRQIKQGMMQELLTGRIRLVDAKPEAGETSA